MTNETLTLFPYVILCKSKTKICMSVVFIQSYMCVRMYTGRERHWDQNLQILTGIVNGAKVTINRILINL